MTEQDEKIAEIERALNAIDLNGPGPTEFAYIMLRNARYLLTELKAEREKRRKLNTRLAEAERANGESIDPARLQIVEKKVAQLKERGFRFAGYIMSDDIRRCTVDKWGRVEWPDFQSQAEAERLQELRTEWATLRLKLSGDIEDVGQADMYGRGWCDAMSEALCRVRKLITRTEAADDPTCIWTLHENDCSYASACGRDWQFIDGGPAENNVRFCHGCGKRVVVADETGDEE